MRGIFITGTDTGIGKTLTSALLAAALRFYKKDFIYFKPVQTGVDNDTATVKDLSGASVIPSTYNFKEPASPHKAARLEGKKIILGKFRESLNSDLNKFVIAEGAGGLLVPLTESETIRDLICQFDIPILIVTSTKLGTINHTLLTLEAARAKNLKIKGLVLNGPEDQGLRETLSELGKIKILGTIPQIKISKADVLEWAPKIFSEECVNYIMDCAK